MTEETLQGGSPAPDALPPQEAPAESSPAPEVADTTAADSGTSEEAAIKSATQKRIDRLTWEKGERDREIAYWRSLAMQRQEAPQEQKPEANTPPTLEQYGHDEAKYQLAVTEYAKSVARAEAQEAIRLERERERAEGRAKTFKTREAEFSAKTEDYQEKVYDPTLPITREMVELIAESEFGPQLAYHLANNRQVAAQIAALPPLIAARELGRIEAKLSAPPPPPPVVSKAPAPPPKIEAVNPEVAKDPSQMTDKEFATWRRRQIAQRRNR